ENTLLKWKKKGYAGVSASTTMRHRIDTEIALITKVERGDSTAKAETGKPDPAWNKTIDVPSVFPNIKPVKLEGLEAFAEKRSPKVMESDSQIGKLQKAKLRLALHELEKILAVIAEGDPRVPYDIMMERILNTTKSTVTTALELTDGNDSRRAWLEIG